MAKLFGTDGIRGEANRYPITPEVALKLGRAVGMILAPKCEGRHPCAVIGRDTRISGFMLESALASGLVSEGVDVMLAGIVPTPAVAHLTRALKADVGFVLTASHNPFTDNGIKLFGPDGFKFDDAAEEEIERLLLDDSFAGRSDLPAEAVGRMSRIEDAVRRTIDFDKGSVAGLDLTGLKIVLDCANGASSAVAPSVFRELGAEVTVMSDSPDGLNINADCGALHPEHMAARVRELGYDLGIALDGDADRVIFSDADGNIVDGDRVLAICARDYKSRGCLAGDTLVCTCMSNLGLKEAMRKIGVEVVSTDVGDRKVIEAMRAGGFRLGGEKSGHLIFLDYATTGDGVMSALCVSRMLRETGRKLGELAADCMVEYPQKLVSMAVREKRPVAEVPALAAAIARAEADMGDAGRVLVRYSGTECKIRLLVEASDAAKVERWMGEISAAVKASLA